MSVADPEARQAMVGDLEQMDMIIGQFLDYAATATPSRRCRPTPRTAGAARLPLRPGGGT